MAYIKFKPVTPTRRFGNVSDFADITTKRPYKPLTVALRKTGGRNNHGHITSRGISGGHRQRLRLVDFRRRQHGIPATVLTVEYDPCRTARIALIEYQGGEKSYIICPDQLKVGETVMSGPTAEVKVGNHVPLKNIPEGTPVHNIELRAGLGAKFVRSAGTVAQILSKENDFAHIKMPSGEVRMIRLEAYATVGQCSHIDRENLQLGKAGRTRWLGRKGKTRGIAKNPVDHPMGGGEGKSKGGNHPQSPWGQKSKGLKTRKRKKASNRYIVKDRRK
ncbi:MAG: 50S ribosomal protein L2 [Omnitrophica bacterium GWA2_52_12]|nr:MAG: 50S ribosomal protein L2 [Omnitrophica bacterium GWA2_52_12]